MREKVYVISNCQLAISNTRCLSHVPLAEGIEGSLGDAERGVGKARHGRPNGTCVP